MKVNLTDRKIKSLKAQDKKYKTWDIAVSGLYVLTMPSGYKAFKLAYRIGKYQKESTLGQYPILSLQAARKQAIKEKQMIQVDKIDVSSEKAQEKRTQNLNMYQLKRFQFVLLSFLRN